MKTTSIASFIVASVFLVVYFLLCGGESSAGIVLLGWMLIARRAQIARWVSAKAHRLTSPINRARAGQISREDFQHEAMHRDNQTQRRLAR
jgi:hypothetical protein